MESLDLPPSARVDQRIPKRHLIENGAPTAADKRQINEGVDELHWLAALKPSTIGVSAYRDAEREYLEIAVLRLALRPSAKAARLVQLVHRAIPYPVLLLTVQGSGIDLSAAHLRWAQNEAGKTVLDGEVVVAPQAAGNDFAFMRTFRESLALAQQPRGSLYTLYQGWIDTLLALNAARLTGEWQPSIDAARATARREALDERARIDAEIARLRNAAAREKQMARKVALNMALKRLEAAKKAATAKL